MKKMLLKKYCFFFYLGAFACGESGCAGVRFASANHNPPMFRFFERAVILSVVEG
jgi:hypothetical protein